MKVTVRAVDADRTHDLRRRVLRVGQTDPELEWPGDHDEATTHFAAFDGDTIVGVSTWLDVDGRVQLRGMATDPDAVGRGIGTMLLDTGVAHAQRHEAAGVWANARVSALDFYLNYGFVVAGPEFVTESTGLPHRLVTFDLV